MNITGVHDRPINSEKPRSCRLLYDFIEGNLNKENINEWAALQVNHIFNLKVLLKVACKKNIEKTLDIIQKTPSTKQAAKRMTEEYGYSPIIHEVLLEMPRKDLLEVQEKEDEYNRLLKRRELLYNHLLLLSKMCDLIDE